MFAELLPILRNRALMITLGLVNEESIRVHVIPKRVKNDDSGDNALAVPLTVTGTAEELDREFAAQLAGFTNSFVKLGSNLTEIQASHSAAVKAVEAEKKKDLENRRKSATSKVAPAAAPTRREPEVKDGKPVFGSRITSADPQSLFDSQAPEESGDEAAMAEPTDVTESDPANDGPQNAERQQKEEGGKAV